MACALLQRGDWLGLRRCPTGPPSNVFGNRGLPCTPGGGCAPCTLLGGGRELALAGRMLPNLRPLPPAWGTGVLLRLAPSFSGGIGLACAVVPPAHPPTFLETGDSPVPPAGAAPPAPCLGAVASLRWRAGCFLTCAPCPLLGERGFCYGLRPPSAEGLGWRAPLSHRPTLQRFWKQGDSRCTPGGGCAPCTPLLIPRRRFRSVG